MSKIEKITKQLQHEQADAAWITTPLNVFYFTGYRSEPHERLFALLITANGDQTLYCPKMEVEEVKNSPFKGKIIGYLDTENPFEIDPSSFNKLLIESEHLTVKRQRELLKTLVFSTMEILIKQLKNYVILKMNPKLQIFAKRQSSLTNASKLVPNSLKSV